MVTNKEIFEEFYQQVKNSKNISEIVKSYGGSPIYVPSYKSTYRNDDILKSYKEGLSIRNLSKEFNLSEAQIYNLTLKVRE